MQQDDSYISFADAMKLLGIDKQRLLRIIKQEKLTTYQNVIDRRQRWLERSVIVAMKMSPMQPVREATRAKEATE